MEKRILYLLIVVVLLCGFVPLTVKAAVSTPDVTITAELSSVNNGSALTGIAHVHYETPALHHENVLLSWHIYTSDGNLLIFENTRYHFTLDNGDADIPVEICLPSEQPQPMLIYFDLVDEQNAFWFSENKLIELKTIPIEYQYHFFDELKSTFSHVIYDQTSVFIFLVLMNIVLVTAQMYIKRKGILQ